MDVLQRHELLLETILLRIDLINDVVLFKSGQNQEIRELAKGLKSELLYPPVFVVGFTHEVKDNLFRVDIFI